MDIKVGEYVRTNRGYFYKIEKIRKSDVSEEVYIVRAHGDNYNFYLRKDNIVKHSFNLIDLIEVGDIVNGFCVTEVGDSSVFVDANYDDVCGEIYKTEIQTILTHEQYNANCYKVKGE